MRKIININKKWLFKKGTAETHITGDYETVDVPHTWNAVDGADGGNDYFRGVSTYQKTLGAIAHGDNEEVFVEFLAVSSVCTVYLNGHLLGTHKGGYSTFRFGITEYLNNENILTVHVDNSARRDVYPQRADFTFYGGIYRDVNIIVVDKTHFDLMYHGGCGVKVMPEINGDVAVEGFVENGDGKNVVYEIYSKENALVARGEVKADGKLAKATLHIDDVHLWNGVSDPYLYTLVAKLDNDSVTVRFGVRSFSVDARRGFFLNGKPYDLIGCSRHQDREGYGSALTKEMMREDMDIIREMGTTTLRLAHYQHNEYIYDIADEYGIIVWAEIPYISEHMNEANENTLSQMKELIIQNYNHPSIICWGLSNEITVVGGVTKECYENHAALNSLCHELDKTRYTTMANLFMLETDSPLVTLPDLRSYNLYYGWYVGEMGENEKWFDEFHEKYPDIAIGLSEYGADANPKYQSSSPEKGDYSETYQALYHEYMLKMRASRPWIWAMHAWNMFDFAADARDEGGKKGQNQKGLVTFDRRTKKDAFYIYKAYLSNEPFVYVCGRRYVNRYEDVTKVKVYSNLDSVTLYVDGKNVQTKNGKYVFEFDVPITSTHVIKAESGEFFDEITVKKTLSPDTEYQCGSKMEVANWFDDKIVIDDSCFSIYDKVKDIKSHPVAGAVYAKTMEAAMKSIGDVAKNVQIPKEMQERMDNMTLEANLKMAGHMVKPEMIKMLNDTLQKIKK